MRNLFLLFFLLAFGMMNAQDTLGKHSRLKIVYSPKTTPKDSVIPAGPNELYLNIGPMLSVLQGTFAQNELNMSFMYKRVLKNPRYALRFGIAWKPQVGNYFDDYDDNAAHTLYDHYLYYDETDTSRTKNVLEKMNVKKTQLNFGIERRNKGYNRWKGFYGLDLVAGVYRNSYLLYDVYEHKDSTGQWTAANVQNNSVMLDYKRSANYYFGLSPKAGLCYSFNPHWVISAQAAFLVAVDFTDNTRRNWDGNSIVMQKVQLFDFTMNGIMDEINLVYRF
jgi:hypothetical protein